MARARRTRRRFRRSGKWSANIQEINNVSITTTQGAWSGTTTLATNPSQNTLGVSQIYTVKNFDINFTIESSNYTQLEAISAYIMYVPQGMTITETYNLDHPEYILNYKYLGSPTAGTQTGTSSTENQQYQPYRVRTRMARKLNTGDSVILFIKGLSETSTATTLQLSGLIRWWTKAN